MDESRQSRLPIVAVLVTALVFLSVLYVLSLGPVILLVENGYLTPDSTGGRALMLIYAPLEWLSAVCKPFNDAVTWYANLWRRE